MRTWRAVGAVGATLVVGYASTPAGILRETLWLVLVVAAFACIVAGIRAHRPRRPRPWWVLATAYGMFASAYVALFPGWTTPALTSVGQVVRLLGFPLLGVAALMLARAQAPNGDRESAIDGAIVMVALATVLSGTVFRPDAVAGEGGVADTLMVVLSPLMVAAVAAATLRLLFVGHVRSVSTVLLVTTAMTGLAANVGRAVLLTAGGDGRSGPVDLVLAVSYLCVALAALHPSMRLLTEPAPPRTRRLTNARLIVLGASLLGAPISLLLRDGRAAVSVPVLAAVVLSVLVVWRLGRLVVDRERVRRQLQVRAERQEGLARISRRALDASLPALYAEATRVCADLLDLSRCEVAAVTADDIGPRAHPVAPADEGVMALIADPPEGRVLDADDATFLETVATTLAGAAQRAEAHDELRRRAVHDPLTGLPNRTVLEGRLAEASERSRRERSVVTVMFIDLDGFKAVNDELGHDAGDELLVSVADRVGAELRRDDLLVRLAGDEFVVVCEDVSSTDAERMADRIVTALARPVRLRAGTVSIGASVGVTQASGEQAAPARVLSDADAAMYAVKGAGGGGHTVRDHVTAGRAG